MPEWKALFGFEPLLRGVQAARGREMYDGFIAQRSRGAGTLEQEVSGREVDFACRRAVLGTVLEILEFL